MRHAMRAEYADQGAAGRAPGPVVSWHMVRDGESMGMCGKMLLPGARTLPETAWGHTDEPFCHTCGALYLREVY